MASQHHYNSRWIARWMQSSSNSSSKVGKDRDLNAESREAKILSIHVMRNQIGFESNEDPIDLSCADTKRVVAYQYASAENLCPDMNHYPMFDVNRKIESILSFKKKCKFGMPVRMEEQQFLSSESMSPEWIKFSSEEHHLQVWSMTQIIDQELQTRRYSSSLMSKAEFGKHPGVKRAAFFEMVSSPTTLKDSDKRAGNLRLLENPIIAGEDKQHRCPEPSLLDLNKDIDSSTTDDHVRFQELSTCRNQWAKRLRYEHSDYYAHSAKRLKLADVTGSRRRVCTTLFNQVLSNEERCPEELSEKTCSWIRRWCHSGPNGATEQREAVPVLCKPENKKMGDGDFQRKQQPSVAAMALMGKSLSSFQGCQFRRRGSSVVWSTKELSTSD